MMKNRWVLPEGIEEVLPEQARKIESLRRQMLDMYDSWGYDQVMPPFIEYLDSLLIGTGSDLDLQTFKITDQLTGRMMGVRADMTPQVARIDAHHLKSDAPTRLCYMGTVLHTRPDGFAGSRSPLQVGAEIYGDSSTNSDIEILSLMLQTIKLAGINQCHLDLGHVGIYRGLIEKADLNTEQSDALFDVMQRKAKPELVQLLNEWKLDKALHDMLLILPDLNGSDALDRAVKVLAKAPKSVLTALANIKEIAAGLQQKMNIDIHFDLAELRGFNYHTGVVFAAYAQGQGQAIAQGGRYDDIGKDFGIARPATGFSSDLKTLIVLGDLTAQSVDAIYAPNSKDDALHAKVKDLRAQGKRVVQALSDKDDASTMGCNKLLSNKDGEWVVINI